MFYQFTRHEDAFRDWWRYDQPGLTVKSYGSIEYFDLCKRMAAEMWCKQRRMEYVIVTVG